MAFATAVVVSVGFASMIDPTSAPSAPATVSTPALAPVALYDEDAEIRALKRRQLDAERADRSRRREAVAASPPPAAAPAAPVAAAPAPPKKRATTSTKAPARRAVPAQRRARPATPVTHAAPADGSRASVVVAFALAQVGKPYIWASAGPRGFDCSGLVKAAYSRVGLGLPHQTGSLVRLGRPVTRDALQPGDIVFPRAQNGSRGHVGIYIGGGRMVHASTAASGIKVSSVYAFWTARRLL